MEDGLQNSIWLFEWLVTPFGLTGAPATFQWYISLREITRVLTSFCSAYMRFWQLKSNISVSWWRQEKEYPWTPSKLPLFATGTRLRQSKVYEDS